MEFVFLLSAVILFIEKYWISIGRVQESNTGEKVDECWMFFLYNNKIIYKKDACSDMVFQKKNFFTNS